MTKLFDGPTVRTVLLALRAVGPCSNRHLAKVLRIDAASCYRRVANLRRKGWADRIDDELYDVTALGRIEILCGPDPVSQTPSLFNEVPSC